MKQQQQQPEEAIPALLKDGQKYYAAKNYNAAVDSFTKAVNLQHRGLRIDRLQSLDLRIGAYVKLSRLNSALTDAKCMVRLGRSDARGYIRCAQLARLTENYGEAVKWYKHGLKNVPESDRMFSYIKVQMNNARVLKRKKAVLSKPRDPMTSFPIEVVEMILSYFEYREHVAILRVSKSWQAVVSRTQLISETLDFYGAKRTVNYCMISASLRRLIRSPKIVKVSNLSFHSSKHLLIHLQRWLGHQGLQELVVDEPGFESFVSSLSSRHLQKIKVEHSVSVNSKAIHDILTNFPQLSTAKFERVTDLFEPYGLWQSSNHNLLKCLKIYAERGNQTPVLVPVRFLEGIPNLIEINCRHCRILNTENEERSRHLTQLRNLKVVAFIDCEFRIQFAFPSSVQNLNLHGSSMPDYEPLPNGGSKLPNLRFLDIDGACFSSEMVEDTCNFTSNTLISHLRINLDDLNAAADHIFARLVRGGWFDAAQYLHITSTQLSDDWPPPFISQCSVLETLSIESAKITGIFIRDILLAPDCRVKTIRLKECRRVSLDIVEWARQRSVEIEIKNGPEKYLGGRRIYQ